MCGIAGFAGQGSIEDVRNMADALQHRGPDGSGYYAEPGFPLFLGHRRLSIVDVEHGAQPMWDLDRAVGVVFNGEIYNHAELRHELEARGHTFSTDHSDTEVLIHGWKQWGRNLPIHLNGMFAFAIWDRAKKVLFLARDRFGEKPLYWFERKNLFMFASELGAFRAHSAFRAEIDDKAVAKFLAHGFIPAPNCIYRHCRKLPAGHWLAYSPADGRIETTCYWQLRIEPAAEPPSLDEAAEHLEGLLRNAVRIRLMSDVPLGIFLSGGIDSSSVASLASEANLKTFAIGFEESSYDESAYARQMASVIGSQHHEERLTMETARDLIPEVLRRLDEPLADPSILPTFLLCRFTRRHVKVALSGDGGDELFAGYDTFAALGPARLYHALVPQLLHEGLVRLVNLMPRSSRNMSLDYKLRRALAGAAAPPEQWNPRWLAPLQPEEIGGLLGMRVDAEELYSEAIEAWHSATSPNPLDRTLEFYTRFYLQDDILTKVDRASMLNSLEVRAAFLDIDVAEFVRKLPADFKYRGGVRKVLLKRAMAKSLPRDILNRPKKGFGIPIAEWLRGMPAARRAAIAPNANFDAVERRDREQRAGQADHRLFLWAWRVLEHHELGPQHAVA